MTSDGNENSSTFVPEDPVPSEKGLQAENASANLPRNVKGFLWALVVLAILSSTFLFSLDNTIVADVQPAIVRQFNSVDQLSWLSVAFLLGAAGTNLFWSIPFPDLSPHGLIMYQGSMLRSI